MAGKRKKVVVSMKKKLEALGRMGRGEPLRSIALEFGVGTSTVSDWKRNRADIEDFCRKMIAKDSLRNRGTTKKAKNEYLDDALFLWYCKARDAGLPITGPKLQAMALRLNKNLPNGDPAFTASLGWLDRWKNRHGIKHLGHPVPAIKAIKAIKVTKATKARRPVRTRKPEVGRLCKGFVIKLEDDPLQHRRNSSDEHDGEGTGKETFSHAEAISMLDKLLVYLNHQRDVAQNEISVIRRLRTRAAGKLEERTKLVISAT